MASGKPNTYKAIGLMSGTSLDGLDIVAVVLRVDGTKWDFEIQHAETLPYTAQWKETLRKAALLSGRKLLLLHQEYGTLTGNTVKDFMHRTGFIPDLIASHGHTIFHEPWEQLTFQLGNGYTIAAITGIPTVWDFRSFDVAMGGQGAPLVPIGDALLFGDYRHCINLGGFANISYEENGDRIAYDPCPVNLAMQHIVEPTGLSYDKNGEMGRHGKVNPALLEALNQLPYYHQPPPKSLGREWLDRHFFPVIDRIDLSSEDKLSTIYEHIAIQLSSALQHGKQDKALLTGGGARNRYLVERIRKLAPVRIEIPDLLIVDFKEALIFALLGVLKLRKEINCYASVTGAPEDLSTGNIVLFNR